MQHIIQEEFPGFEVTENVQKCLTLVFCRAKFEQMMLYDDIEASFRPLGIRDVKNTESNQINGDYNELDKKSIRIINRMIHFLGSQGINFSDFMSDIVQMQDVKTKKGSQ